jgi:hypothetical protein
MLKKIDWEGQIGRRLRRGGGRGFLRISRTARPAPPSLGPALTCGLFYGVDQVGLLRTT